MVLCDSIFVDLSQGFGGDISPPVSGTWINDLGNQFVDDLGNVVVFDI